MKVRDFFYYISKFTLIDEILGAIYWALIIYGIYLIVGFINGSILMIGILCIYIVSTVIFYIVLLKKIKSFFKGYEVKSITKKSS